MSNIRVIDRAFSILRLIANNPNGVGVNAIAQAVELPKSTTSRILSTLEMWEAVQRTADNQFQIGPELVRLTCQQPFTQNLAVLARPILQDIAGKTGEAVALCNLDDLQTYQLDHVQSQHAIRVRDYTGEHLPLNVSAAGKIFLAFGPPNLIDAFLARPLPRYTDRTITTPNDLCSQLPQIRAQGYALTDEEFEDDVIGLAVPVQDSEGNVMAALNIYGPKFRLQPADKQQEIVQIMMEGAAQLAHKLP